MSQIVPCERLNCSSKSLSNTRRLARTVSSIARTRSADVEGHPLLCSSVTQVTATKFPTPFSHMLHGHHIWAINCSNFTMNFNWSCPFCPQKPNNWSHFFVSTHAVQYPLQNCVIHENCGAWAMKVLPSSNQCLNFKWIKGHLTMWSYLVAIK